MEDKKTIKPKEVKERSILADLTKYAFDEYIKPKTNDILHNLFIGVIDMFGDSMKGTIDKQFYGEDRNKYRSKNNTVRTFNQEVPYHVYSLNSSNNNSVKTYRVNNSQRSSKRIKTIVLETEDDARYIINNLRNEIKEYGNVKVGKLYEMIKEPTSPEDWKFGWTNQDDIGYTTDHGNYILSLAEPINVLEK